MLKKNYRKIGKKNDNDMNVDISIFKFKTAK